MFVRPQAPLERYILNVNRLQMILAITGMTCLAMSVAWQSVLVALRLHYTTTSFESLLQILSPGVLKKGNC